MMNQIRSQSQKRGSTKNYNTIDAGNLRTPAKEMPEGGLNRILNNVNIQTRK